MALQVSDPWESLHIFGNVVYTVDVLAHWSSLNLRGNGFWVQNIIDDL